MFKVDYKNLTLSFNEFHQILGKDMPQYGEFCLLELKNGDYTAGSWNPSEGKNALSGKFIRGTADVIEAKEVERWHSLERYDLTESLMPYVKEHWSVKTGRENTAIAGFSMGGRESIYCTLMHPELFGYCCAASPAPGIVPASDNFLANHLGSLKADGVTRMTNADLKFSDADLPFLLMIGCGTNDGTVGQFPKKYHEAFTANGTRNIWLEVQGADHDSRVGTPMFYTFFRFVFKA